MSEEKEDLKAKRPLLKKLSISDYKPDEKVINQALWGSDEPPRNVNETIPNPLPDRK